MRAATTTNQKPPLPIIGRDRPIPIQSASSYQKVSQSRKPKISIRPSWKPERETLFIHPPLFWDPSIFSKSVKYAFEYLKEFTYQSHLTSQLGIKKALMEKLVKFPRESPYVPNWTQGSCCPNHWWGGCWETLMLSTTMVLRNVRYSEPCDSVLETRSKSIIHGYRKLAVRNMLKM